MSTNEQDSTTTARIYPRKQVVKPLLVCLDNLEAIRERELQQRRERVLEFNSRGW